MFALSYALILHIFQDNCSSPSPQFEMLIIKRKQTALSNILKHMYVVFNYKGFCKNLVSICAFLGCAIVSRKNSTVVCSVYWRNDSNESYYVIQARVSTAPFLLTNNV